MLGGDVTHLSLLIGSYLSDVIKGAVNDGRLPNMRHFGHQTLFFGGQRNSGLNVDFIWI